MTTESTSYANLLYANGVHTIGGINYYPDFNFWEIIDPEHKHEYIYNRYAHVYTALTKGSPSLVLLQGDAIRVDLNVEIVKNLGITHILTKSSIDDIRKLGLSVKELFSDDIDGLHILEILN